MTPSGVTFCTHCHSLKLSPVKMRFRKAPCFVRWIRETNGTEENGIFFRIQNCNNKSIREVSRLLPWILRIKVRILFCIFLLQNVSRKKMYLEFPVILGGKKNIVSLPSGIEFPSASWSTPRWISADITFPPLVPLHTENKRISHWHLHSLIN